MTKKFYIAGYKDFGVSGVWRGYGCQLVRTMDEADIVIFTGGTDIACDLYNEKAHSRQQSPNLPRDAQEIDEYYAAVGLGKNIFGICRGAQLIHVLNGGKLWQHVNNHMGGHEVRDLVTGNTHYVSSCHHQMMRVDSHPHGNEEFTVVAVAAEATCREMWDFKMKPKNGSDIFTDDIEVLWYPRVRAICYQAHPEFGVRTDSRYAYELQKRYGFFDDDDNLPPEPKIKVPSEFVMLSRLRDRMDLETQARARMHAH